MRRTFVQWRTSSLNGTARSAIITIDRPARFNAWTSRPRRTSAAPALQIARDDEVRVVVLRGLPGMFCSGADLKFIATAATAHDLGYLTRAHRSRRRGYRRGVQADSRIHPQHDLGNPSRPEAIHRRGRRHRRRRRDSASRWRAISWWPRRARIRVGVREDRADRRGELDVPAAAPRRPAPRDGADAASIRGSTAARRSSAARHRGAIQPRLRRRGAGDWRPARPPARRARSRSPRNC